MLVGDKVEEMKPPFKIWDEIKEDERRQKMRGQKTYCELQNMEMFIIKECPKCKKNILDLYSVQECNTTLITSCRWCNNSLVD